MKSTAEVVKVKDVMAWIDAQRDSTEGNIALRAITRDGKPVELTAEQTRMLADRLTKLADVLESLSQQRRETQD